MPYVGLNPDAGPITKITQHRTISPYVTGADWARTVLPTVVLQLPIMLQSMT